MWSYLPHQIAKAKEAINILKSKGFVYIRGEVRSGKTPTIIYIAEQSKKIQEVLVVAPLKAHKGWERALANLPVTKKYILINPESLHKIPTKHNYQLLVIDEAHLFGAVGRPTKRYKELRRIAKKGLLKIWASGTPIIETPASIYYQTHFPPLSPFECNTFYQFFRKWGIPTIKYIAGRAIKEYKQVKPELLDYINSFSIIMTQKEAGINIEVKDKLVYIDLSDKQKEVYNEIIRNKMYIGEIGNQQVELIADSIMKERVLLHQIEGGIIKTESGAISFNKQDIAKYQYLLSLGAKEIIGVMSHFKAEQEFLKANLPSNFEVYSSNAHAEGVDLSHLDRFIIYSSDYSGSKWVQRRDRITNIKGSKTNEVEILVTKNAISEQVYKAVSKKKDFNNSLFQAIELN